MKPCSFLALLLAAAVLAACSTHVDTAPARTTSASAPVPAAPRTFDLDTVRSDYFRGFAGDEAALAAASDACDRVLAVNANDPEALAWRGAVDSARSAHAYERGDFVNGRAAWDHAMERLNRAAALAPSSLAARIPRGAVLFGAIPYLQDPALQRALLPVAISDYELAYAREAAHLDDEPVHGRSELLFALADGYAQLGDEEHARLWYGRLNEHAPATELAAYGRRYLAGERKLGARPACTGCHG